MMAGLPETGTPTGASGAARLRIAGYASVFGQPDNSGDMVMAGGRTWSVRTGR